MVSFFGVDFNRDDEISFSWSTLRTVLFSLLGVVLAAVAALIAFFVIRFVEGSKEPIELLD